MTGSLLAELADRFGTPLYVYDLAELRAACTDLAAGLPPGAHVFYSLKANPNPAVVRQLVELGCRAEVCSPHELDAAIEAGARPANCLYTGPGKTVEEIRYALTRGVGTFSADSPTDLRRIGRCAGELGTVVRAILRLNPSDYPAGAGLAMGGAPTQFGADVSWVRARPDEFRADRVWLAGYHVYVGANAADVEQLGAWFDCALDAVEQAQAGLGLELELLDLGGGFGHPYARPGARPDLRALRGRLAQALHARALRPVEVAFESGRYLAGAAGQLVLRVQDVKLSKGRRVVVADGGINVLGGMQALRRIPPILAVARPAHPGAEPVGDALLTGPLCTTVDVLNQRLPLPEVVPGDLLVVPNVGAYGLTASMTTFLGRPAAAEVCVEGEMVRAAFRQEFTYRRLGRSPGGIHNGREAEPVSGGAAAPPRRGRSGR